MLDEKPNLRSSVTAYYLIIAMSFMMGLFYWKTLTTIETGVLRRGMLAITAIEMAFDAVKWHGELIVSALIAAIGCGVQFKFRGNGILTAVIIWLIITMFYLFAVAINLLPILRLDHME